MATASFSGFGANMFLPFYGSSTIEAVNQKLLDDQVEVDLATLSLTQITLFTLGGSRAGRSLSKAISTLLT